MLLWNLDLEKEVLKFILAKYRKGVSRRGCIWIDHVEVWRHEEKLVFKLRVGVSNVKSWESLEDKLPFQGKCLILS